jgi:hypothetical protein
MSEESVINNASSVEITCAFDCTEQNVQRCRKCNRPFCIMHANRFSPNLCKECFTNLSVVEGKFQRTFEDYDAKSDKVTLTRETCTKYYMDGPDWPFLNAWIDTLTDDELRTIWNFHFFVMKTIESENETRKIEKYRKLREAPTPKLVSTVKTVKKTVAVQQPETADSIRAKLKKQGLPDAIIDQMVAVMKL